MVVDSYPQRRGERGQLVLIAAILVAVAVLGAVVLLNTIHSSPNIKAQTDARSVSDAERMTAQVQNDLETVFVATNVTDGEQYPFVSDETKLETMVEEYKNQSVELLSTNRSALLNVTYDPGQSRTGNFTAGELPVNQEVMVDAEAIPSLSVTSDGRVHIAFTGSVNEMITLRGGSTTVPGGCSGLSDEPLTLDFSRGSGVIRDESGGACVVELYDPAGVTDLTVEIDSTDSGSYALSGVDPDASRGDTVVTNVVVNPAFDLEYVDPDVTYSSEFLLFGGDR